MDAVRKYIQNVTIGLALQHLERTSKSHVAHHVECQAARPGGHVPGRTPTCCSLDLGIICLAYHTITEDIDVLQNMIFHCLHHVCRECLCHDSSLFAMPCSVDNCQRAITVEEVRKHIVKAARFLGVRFGTVDLPQASGCVNGDSIWTISNRVA